MFKRVFQLFKIGRKFASSGALITINKIYKLPISIRILFEFLSIGTKKKNLDNTKTSGQKLCDALQEMGTTFIKLGQFLATRPEIIGEEVSKKLEKLQDRLPPFKMSFPSFP